MDRRTITGVPWTLLTYAGNKLITVATTIVLSRLLVPEDFGIITLASLAIAFANVLRDLGLGGALIVRQDLDRHAQGTVLTLMLVMGIVVGLGLAAAAPLLADLFDEPRLDEVIVVLSIAVFLGGFNWFYETVMQRELEFRRRFVSLALQSCSYALVAIVLAFADAGVWSLVAGQLTGYVVLAAALVTLTPYRVRPSFDRVTARSVISTGWGFMAQGGLAAVQQNSDYIAVGSVLGAGQVGLYSMSYRLSEIPYVGIADPVAKATFPSFARMRHDGQDIIGPFLSTLRSVALVACPLGVLLSAAAEPFTLALLGDKWAGMVGALAVLGVWGAVRPVQATTGWLLNSAGEAKLMAGLSVIALVPLVPLLFVAADLGGIEAVAWIMLVDLAASLVLIAAFAQRRVGVAVRSQALALAPIALACLPCWLATRLVAEGTDQMAVGVTLALASVAGVATYVVAVALVEPGLLGRFRAQVRRSLGDAPEQPPPDRVAP